MTRTKAWGIAMLVAGGVTIPFAWNYSTHCDYGEYTSRFDLPYPYSDVTYCSTVTRYSSNVREAGIDADFGRQAVLLTGVGMVATGLVLLAVSKPKVQRVTKGVDVGITPGGWHATKTLAW